MRRAARAVCPYCAESVDLTLDPGGASRQEYVEDCPVCCRPWVVVTRWDPSGRVDVELRRESD